MGNDRGTCLTDQELAVLEFYVAILKYQRTAPVRQRRLKLSDEQIEEIRWRLSRGEESAQIARKMHIDRAITYYYAHKGAAPPKRDGDSGRKRQNFHLRSIPV